MEHHFQGRKLEVRPFYSKAKFQKMDSLSKNRKAYISDLPISVDGNTLAQLFSIYGKIENAYLGNFEEVKLDKTLAREASIPQGKRPGVSVPYRLTGTRNKRFGFVIFSQESSLLKALGQTVSYQGHQLRVRRPHNMEQSSYDDTKGKLSGESSGRKAPVNFGLRDNRSVL